MASCVSSQSRDLFWISKELYSGSGTLACQEPGEDSTFKEGKRHWKGYSKQRVYWRNAEFEVVALCSCQFLIGLSLLEAEEESFCFILEPERSPSRVSALFQLRFLVISFYNLYNT